MTGEEAYCITCGYSLRGLPEPVCPECGRRFDPNDSATFDTDAHRRRRRKWVKRGLVACLIAVFTFAIAPRQLLKSELVLNCTKCKESTTFHRWDLLAPRWISLRYPGIGWNSKRQTTASAKTGACPPHKLDVRVRLRRQAGGWIGGHGTCDDGKAVTLNGKPVGMTNASRLLKAMTNPNRFGFDLDCQPQPQPYDGIVYERATVDRD